MAHILDERNRENSLCDDSYAAHNDLGLQLPAFEMSLRPPPGFDDRLQRTSTTQHADTDPLLMDTETAPSESNDREYDFLSVQRDVFQLQWSETKMWPPIIELH